VKAVLQKFLASFLMHARDAKSDIDRNFQQICHAPFISSKAVKSK